MESLKAKIRNIPDFPKPGIQFKDLTPLMRSPETLRLAVEELVHPFRSAGITVVAGMEARGFIFGSLAARELNVGFVPLRKPGKLPYEVKSAAYELEYGLAELQVHTDAVSVHDRVLLVDDLIATGGTAAASCRLLESLGAEVAACAFVVELDALQGRRLLHGRHIHAVLHF